MTLSFKAFFLVSLSVFFIAANAFAEEKNPRDFQLTITTKNIPGARAHMTATIQAPVERTWLALLDVNHQAGIYPRIKQAACIPADTVEAVKKESIPVTPSLQQNLPNGPCNPYLLRKKGAVWTLHLFQEIDYPFPLSDRWILAKVTNNESEISERKFIHQGELAGGKQKLHRFTFTLKPHPQNPNVTLLDADIWTDPGGIIMGWMIREASQRILPKYVEILEILALK